MTPDFLLAPWLEPRTAYIHIPFCVHQCGYCDFAVSAGDDSAIPLYLEALAVEMESLKTQRKVETMFIGGGTPTHLNVEQLGQLFTTLHRWFRIAGDEFTIEANPDSLDAAKVEFLASQGVTRLSLGVQSFQPALLTALERRHSQSDIRNAVELARKYKLAVSLDLIFAAPGATPELWEADLTAAIQLEPDHLSTYGLTYEKGTRLWKGRERGAVTAVGETDELRMYETAIERLTAVGYEHYEISNFAKPGHRCKHNERYWANHAYYGFGVGAARYVNGVRELNVRGTRDYIRKVLAIEPVVFQSECLVPRERAMETMAVQLRRCEGIHRAEFAEQTGFALDELIGRRLAMPLAEGLLEETGTNLRLTPKGKCVADGIIESLMAG